MTLTANQVKQARAQLGWPRAKLAVDSRVATKTVADFEEGLEVPDPAVLDRLRATIEASGALSPAPEPEGRAARRPIAGRSSALRYTTTVLRRLAIGVVVLAAAILGLVLLLVWR
jgi:hypothetical protein